MGHADRRSSHRFLVALLLSLATLATIGALGARWLDDQVVSTSGWTKASGQLLKDPTVRKALAGYAVQRAFSAGGIDRALDASLGDAAGGAAALRLRAAAQSVAERELKTRRVRRAWRTANRSAQSQLLRAVDRSGDNRPVVIDLTPIVADVLRAVAGSTVARSIPGGATALTSVTPGAGRLVVLQPGQAKLLRTGVDTVRTLAWALPAAALVGFLLALLLAAGRRTRTLSRIGYRLIISGAIVLVVRWAVQFPVADTLSALGDDRPAVRAAWLGATSGLRALAVGVLIAGAAITVVSWCARAALRVN